MGWTIDGNGIHIYSGTTVGDTATAIASNATALTNLISSSSGNYLPLTGGTLSGPVRWVTNSSIGIEYYPGTTLGDLGQRYSLTLGDSHAAATYNNLLDDGAGNMTVTGGLNLSSNQYLNLGSGVLSPNLYFDGYVTTHLSTGQFQLDVGGLFIGSGNPSLQGVSGNVNVQGIQNGLITSGGNVLDDGGGSMACYSALYFGAPMYNTPRIQYDGSGGLIFADTQNNEMTWNNGLTITGNLTFNPGNNGNTISIVATNNTYAGQGQGVLCLGVYDYGVATLNNVLDDGSGNLTATGSITGNTLVGYGVVISGYGLAINSSGGWNGHIISATYGGTGVNNGSKTVTLGGNLTTANAFNASGNYALTLTTTATTNATLPSGTTTLLASNGNGSSLTSLNASSISSGTIGNSYLPSAISVTTLQGAYVNTMAFKNTSYNITASDSVILVNSASNIVMTLPSASTATAGREYTIKTINSAATVKTSASGQKIDGTDYSSTGLSLSANNKYITIVSDGSTNWYIVANN